jgi:hypothetical protein
MMRISIGRAEEGYAGRHLGGGGNGNGGFYDAGTPG